MIAPVPPAGYLPMLAVPWERPFADGGWAFELKWDGVRALLAWDGARARIRSRTGRDITAVYPELSRPAFDRPCVLDGEIVAFGPDGLPSFERLQSRMNLSGAARVARAATVVPVAMVVFDLLYLDGDIVDLPWEERRRRLESFGPASPCLRSDVVFEDGLALWDAIVARRLEGMVAKRITSPYRPGQRSPDWRKIANRHSARVVVGGYTRGTGGRTATFGALLTGLVDGQRLRYVGSVGTGFDAAGLAAIRAALDQMGRADSPFWPDPALPAGARWVEPGLVAVVEHKAWTAAGRLRAPSFRGFTEDDWTSVTLGDEGPGTRTGSGGVEEPDEPG